MKTVFDPILLELLKGESELPEEATTLLAQVIETYRRGGEGFTFKEWCAFSPTTQSAFIAIGDKLREQAAARVAYYMTNPMEMLKTLFGEEAAMKFALENSMAEARK